MAKDALGHGSEQRGGPQAPDAAHQTGVNLVGHKAVSLPPESSTSRELRLFADNNANLARLSLQPIRDNLGKKMDKGVYDPQKAETLWGYHADRAAQAYVKEHGSPGDKWHAMFPPQVRREAAAHWQADEAPDIKSGSSRSSQARDSYGRTDADLKRDYGGPVRHFSVDPKTGRTK